MNEEQPPGGNGLGEQRPRAFQRQRIGIYRQDPAIGRGGVEQQTGVSRAAKRAVEIAGASMRLKRGHCLTRHHRRMHR
jgi:hypothetical protein